MAWNSFWWNRVDGVSSSGILIKKEVKFERCWWFSL